MGSETNKYQAKLINEILKIALEFDKEINKDMDKKGIPREVGGAFLDTAERLILLDKKAKRNKRK